MSYPEKERGAGQTWRQMEAAPKGAVYVWCNNRLGYPRDLARRLGRSDLEIAGPDYLEGKFRGRRVPIVVDHAAELNARGRLVVRMANDMAAR